MAVEHRLLNANLVSHTPPGGKTTTHLTCLCACGYSGHLPVTASGDDPFGVALNLLSRMQSVWEAHLTPVVEVGAK